MQYQIDSFRLETAPISELQVIKGIYFPASLKFRKLLITGPPGAGKSTLMKRLGGWSEEGYVDLSLNRWWAAQALALRPREIHLGFPCKGYKDALAVFDEEWILSLTPPELDLKRISLPPIKRHFFSVDWSTRYTFEFLIPPVETLFRQRAARADQGTHRVDEGVNIEQVRNQVVIYQMAADYLFRNGLDIYIREGSDGGLFRIVDSENR